METLHDIEGLVLKFVDEERGLMQGDPLLTTIFNVVVDAVVLHWE